VNGFDLVILAILSTTAIVIVGFAAKAYYIIRYDWNRGHSLLEVKPVPPAAEKESLLHIPSREIKRRGWDTTPTDKLF
jgi:hypothetical protein